MEEFSRDLQPGDGQTRTGMICPDCGGNITVHAVGDDISDGNRLVFQCRVGHRYALDELLIGKEEHIERVMWAAVYAYEELAGILRTMSTRDGGGSNAASDEQCRVRTARAEDIATALRALIQRDDVVKLKPQPDAG